MMKLKLTMVAGLVVGLMPASARADLWTPLDGKPLPNVVLGIDHSITSGQPAGCSNCHMPDAGQALATMKGYMVNTMDLFQRYFVWGGYTYNACGSAHISWRQLPTPLTPNASFTSLRTRIQGLNSCGSGEKGWPGGNTTASCLVPDVGCASDPTVIADMGLNGIVGMSITSPGASAGLPIPCDRVGAPLPQYDLAAALTTKLGLAFTWPRLSTANAAPAAAAIDAQICNPIAGVLAQIRSEIALCLDTSTSTAGTTIVPDDPAYWDMTFLDSPTSTWCDAPTMSTTMCSTRYDAAPNPVGFQDTCVCDDSNPLCAAAASNPLSDCGIPGMLDPYPWNRPAMRQQVAVCESYASGPGRFLNYFTSQGDNRVNGGCRENVNIILSDALHGQLPSVDAEAAQARATGAYWSLAGLSNQYMFATGTRFYNYATWMSYYLSNYTRVTPYNAYSLATMQEAFATVLSRTYKGVYVGAGLGTDGPQTRVAVHSMTVPGYSSPSNPVSDTYHAFASRVSVLSVNPSTGALAPSPVYESDWASKQTPVAACDTQINVAAGVMQNRLGPGGVFRNGVPRTQTLTTGQIDRDGVRDGAGNWIFNGATETLPAGGVTIGNTTGFAAGTPIFVGAPQDVADNGFSAGYKAFSAANRTRPQILYFADGAYVMGVHAGVYRSPGAVNGYQQLSFDYDDSVPQAGHPTFRYRPLWTTSLAQPNVTYDWNINDLVPQPIIVGSQTERDVRINTGWAGYTGPAGVQYRSVLVGNQGYSGPGWYALDVTNPCDVQVIAEWTQPMGTFASGAPSIISWASSADPKALPAVVTTSGLGSSMKMLYAYNIRTGGLLSSVSLAGVGSGASQWPTAPACVDITGKGSITHCYVLSDDGYVARVDVNTTIAGNGVFGVVRDVTPRNASNVALSVGGGLVYSSAPVAYFDDKGQVNLVFGSGDFRNPTGVTPQNYLFRAIDLASRSAGLPASSAVMRFDNACLTDGSSTDGRIALGLNERMLSAPQVTSGLVLFGTYQTTSTGCASGSGSVYAMNAETCAEANPANGVNPRPTGVSLGTGSGIGTTPVYHRQSGRILAAGSGTPTAPQIQNQGTTNSKNSRFDFKRLYFRVGRST